LLLKGDGNNGKDTLREAVAALYGYQGTTGCTLSDFKAYDDGRKFPLARLKNSRVNWATENANTAALDKIQSIKAFLTGDTLSCEGKGKDETDYNPTAIGLFNVNDTPNMKGTLEAIASRWGILLFLKTFKEGADPAKGEIEADPRFKYDPAFLKQEVLPAFLNQVLAALPELMTTGIDYSCTQQALEDIQRENSHLFQFAQDVGLTFDPNSTVTAGEIWNQLEQWYLNNGTLTYEQSSSGKKAKAIWQDQPRKSDGNVKAVNQVIRRFQELFPKAKVVTIQGETKGKPRMALQGIGFINLTPRLTQNTSELTQRLTQELTQEPLQDKVVNPVNPISYVSEEKKEIDSNAMSTDPDLVQQENNSAISQNFGLTGLTSNTESSNSNASNGLTQKNHRVNGSPNRVNQDDVDTEFSIDLSAIDFSDCKSVAKALQQAYAMGDGHQKTVGTIYSKASLNVKTLIDGLSGIPDDAKKYIQDCYELVKNDQSRKVK
jgi:putative DNA primase/helicase